VVCIGDNPQMARFLYKKTVGVLDQETGNRGDRADDASTSASSG